MEVWGIRHARLLSSLLSEMSTEFQKAPWTLMPPARVNLTPSRTITCSPSPRRRTSKEVLLLMSLWANQVYRHSHWSQVSFKHRVDPKAVQGFLKRSLILHCDPLSVYIILEKFSIDRNWKKQNIVIIVVFISWSEADLSLNNNCTTVFTTILLHRLFVVFDADSFIP